MCVNQLALEQSGGEHLRIGLAEAGQLLSPLGIIHDVHQLRVPDVALDPADEAAAESQLADELGNESNEVRNGTWRRLQAPKHTGQGLVRLARPFHSQFRKRRPEPVQPVQVWCRQP